MTVTCHVCGKDTLQAGSLLRQNRKGKIGIWACHDHRLRIRCAVEGCSRTTAKQSDGYGEEEWMCPVHWRRHCPPRSLRRRCYLRYFRRAKRHGWTDDLRIHFWRFWDMLVRLANEAETKGSIDMDEIRRMFGWEENDCDS